MAEKAARKKPVRTAPARKDYATEIEWLQAKLDHAQKQAATEAQAKVGRIEKRIATQQGVIARATARINELEKERDEARGLVMSGTPADEV